MGKGVIVMNNRDAPWQPTCLQHLASSLTERLSDGAP